MNMITFGKNEDVLRLIKEGKSKQEIEKLVQCSTQELYEIVSFLNEMSYVKIYKGGILGITKEGNLLITKTHPVKKGIDDRDNSSFFTGIKKDICITY